MIVSLGYRKNGFDAFGGKVLKKEDMSYWTNSKERTDPRGVALDLNEEIREVEPDFFELLPTISSVWIHNPKCKIPMTEKTLELFRKNRVLLRGEYDTVAEKMAREYGLRFLHLDVELCSVGDYFQEGVDIITIRFRDDGSVYVNQDCRCQGISAGNTGGGEVDIDLRRDFYRRMTPEELAGMCWRTRTILENGKLAAFMAKAKEKKGYLLDFSRPEK